MEKIKLYVENEGKRIFQTGTINDIVPNTNEDIDIIIKKLKRNIIFLNGVKVGIENKVKNKIEDVKVTYGYGNDKIAVNLQTLNSILLEGEELEIEGESKVVNSFNFIGGMLEESFKLSDNFNYETVKFISDSNIFYKKNLITKKGEEISFFYKKKEDNIVKVIFDIRVQGSYGIDFRKDLVNDGCGNFGKNFDFKITPKYTIKI